MPPDAAPFPADSEADLRRILAASGVVGTWSWFEAGDHCVLDAGAAALLAGDRALAGAALPADRARACLHADDRNTVLARFSALCRSGGLFVAQYRVLAPGGRTHAILDRGRIFRGSGGAPGHGHGLLIDLGDEALPDGARTGRALDEAASRIIACRRTIDRFGFLSLRPAVDRLLLRIAQDIARSECGRLH
ncbi:hypothetical protein J2X36_004423 [Methylobacterium sp. BE186]|uniref:PAS domain-containing protein n=1 Tax=Methylobacterium sp. BE186 TaxID=2817715 RepID=UPI002854FFA8|nr:PAS domain-containing protein [Methylobacterium sp. BE186]MDR7039646.1 hypothetical protein [Methylobacterium sp. BE186]